MKDADLAFLSWAVYEPLCDFERLIGPRGYRVLETFHHQGTEAALAKNADHAAIVFRGTEASHFKVRDIYSNLTWPWPTVWQGAGRVHSGYRRHLNLVGYEAMDFCEGVASEVPLYITGHSLGGAIGTLFCSWYFWHHRRRTPAVHLAGLVTFGAPKALDQTAAAWIKCDIRRYTVRKDWAPLWPPLPCFGHPIKGLALEPAPAFNGILNRHNVRGYVEALTLVRN